MTRAASMLKRPACWIWLAVAVAVGIGFASWLHVCRRKAGESLRVDRLRCFSWVLREYHRAHGEFPPSLEVELPFHHCFDSLEAYAWKGHEIQYIKPEPGSTDQAVLYLWPPHRGGTAVFYMDTDVDGGVVKRRGEWVELNQHGDLVHPRTDKLIAKGSGDT